VVAEPGVTISKRHIREFEFIYEETWDDNTSIMDRLQSAALDALRAIIPLCLFLYVVLRLVLRQRLHRGTDVGIGVSFALAGMALFGLGIALGLTPLGEQLGSNVPIAFAEILPWGLNHVEGPLLDEAHFGKLLAIGFAFFLGYGATLAEPALNALGDTVERTTAGAFRKKLLMQSVAVGVGLGIGAGIVKMAYNLPLIWMILPPYALVLVLTWRSPHSFVNFSWDSAGVTTGPITVPLVLAMGLGIGANVPGVSNGFGVLALASVGPILTVLAVGLYTQRQERANQEATAPCDSANYAGARLMIESTQSYSTVTAVLPGSMVSRVMGKIEEQQGASALAWKGRGTALHDHWLKRYLPPISPAKSLLQMLVPEHDVERVVQTVAEQGNLHQQAIGAVFSTPCQQVYFGSDFRAWPSNVVPTSHTDASGLNDNLNLICCVVGHHQSDRVAKAAVNAGAHGPIVYYSEGRGLRDRLGWLRITKEVEKEVLMVIASDNDVEEVFDAMAKAGELHLPGRGFMYRLLVDKGLFNLPGRVSNHAYAANIQQIINAIDHLAGHTNWRDQSVFAVGGNGKGVGLKNTTHQMQPNRPHLCLSAIARRDDTQRLMDLMLDNGAPGLNLNYARYSSIVDGEMVAGARINQDYGVIRCVIDAAQASSLCQKVTTQAPAAGLTDVCLMQFDVPQIATYVPGRKDYRQADQSENAAA